jgi:hypothetical protein
MTARVLAVAASCVLSFGSCAASAAPADEARVIGQRVRVKTAKAKLTGSLVELRADTLVLERQRGQDAERLEVPRAQILSVERSAKPSRKGRGAMIGVIVGVGAAVAIGIAEGEDCHSVPGPATLDNFVEKLNSELCMNQTETGLLSAVLTVPLGALLGHSIAPGERWEPVARAQLSVQPLVLRSGGGVRGAIRF